MHYKLFSSCVFAASLAATTAAPAQGAGFSTMSPATPPALIAPMPTGNNTSGINQPGVPNTSTPGLIGTGATPSGLAGDSIRHPGFPGRIGSLNTTR